MRIDEHWPVGRGAGVLIPLATSVDILVISCTHVTKIVHKFRYSVLHRTTDLVALFKMACQLNVGSRPRDSETLAYARFLTVLYESCIQYNDRFMAYVNSHY